MADWVKIAEGALSHLLNPFGGGCTDATSPAIVVTDQTNTALVQSASPNLGFVATATKDQYDQAEARSPGCLAQAVAQATDQYIKNDRPGLQASEVGNCAWYASAEPTAPVSLWTKRFTALAATCGVYPPSGQPLTMVTCPGTAQAPSGQWFDWQQFNTSDLPSFEKDRHNGTSMVLLGTTQSDPVTDPSPNWAQIAQGSVSTLPFNATLTYYDAASVGLSLSNGCISDSGNPVQTNYLYQCSTPPSPTVSQGPFSIANNGGGAEPKCSLIPSADLGNVDPFLAGGTNPQTISGAPIAGTSTSLFQKCGADMNPYIDATLEK